MVVVQPAESAAANTENGRSTSLNKTRLLILVVFLPILLLAGCGSSETKITRAEYGDKWPFTVDEGVLSFRDTGRTVGTTRMVEVTFTADGVTYGINGTAKGNDRYSDVDAIWANNPSCPGARKDIGPILDRGLALGGYSPLGTATQAAEHSSKVQPAAPSSAQTTEAVVSNPKFEAFVIAAEEGDAATVAKMLKTDRSLVQVRESGNIREVGRNNPTALHCAAAAGQTRVARILIRYKADVNARNDEDGRTPLHYAATEGHADIARLLIASGANLEAVDLTDLTPLAEACCSSMDDPAHIEFVELLLSKGANVNGNNKAACTPLQLAGDGKIAGILRKHGATQ
jgi:hypothetical protein